VPCNSIKEKRSYSKEQNFLYQHALKNTTIISGHSEINSQYCSPSHIKKKC